jgi:hypothetical protein
MNSIKDKLNVLLKWQDVSFRRKIELKYHTSGVRLELSENFELLASLTGDIEDVLTAAMKTLETEHFKTAYQKKHLDYLNKKLLESKQEFDKYEKEIEEAKDKLRKAGAKDI